MTERPVYKIEPYESPAKLPGAVVSLGNGAVLPHETTAPAPPFIHSIVEVPQTADVTTSIVKAGTTLHRVATERISQLEAELKQLRSLQRLFAGAAGQGPENVAPSVTEGDLQKLLRFADAFESCRPPSGD